jgi:hypothetical protein
MGPAGNESVTAVMRNRPVWQGVYMDSVKFHSGPPCLTRLHHAAVSGVARPQGKQPAAVFYPLGYPTPYGLGTAALWAGICSFSERKKSNH